MVANDKQQRVFTGLLAGLLLALMAVLAGGAALRESVTIDEVAHIGAGVSYLQKLDLRMNPEHPPLPKVLAALAQRARYNRVVLLVGARSPDDLLFARELETWRRRGADVQATVDRANPTWKGHVVDLVTGFIGSAVHDPAQTAAFVCGPEIMIRLCAHALVSRGVAADNILVSLERNMRCGAALCGHCQLGPLLLCRDGPVVSYADAAPLAAKKEL